MPCACSTAAATFTCKHSRLIAAEAHLTSAVALHHRPPIFLHNGLLAQYFLQFWAHHATYLDDAAHFIYNGLPYNQCSCVKGPSMRGSSQGKSMRGGSFLRRCHLMFDTCIHQLIVHITCTSSLDETSVKVQHALWLTCCLEHMVHIVVCSLLTTLWVNPIVALRPLNYVLTCTIIFLRDVAQDMSLLDTNQLMAVCCMTAIRDSWHDPEQASRINCC